MKYSKQGHFHYDTPLDKCLLTGGELIEDPMTKPSVYKYTSYKPRSAVKLVFYKTIILLNLISIFIALLIDYNSNHSLSWSWIVVTSNVYAIILVSLFLRNFVMLPRLVLFSIVTMAYIALIGHLTNNIRWALDIVIPFIFIGAIFFLTLLLIFNRKRYYDIVSYIFLLSILGLIPLLFVLVGFTKENWASIAAGAYALITLLSIVLFSSKASKEEFKRRFHI